MWNFIRAAGPALLQPVLQATNAGCHRGMLSLFSTLCRSKSPSMFLIPKPAITTQVAGIKVKGIVRERCPGCRRYMKDERLFIYCMNYPKHNQKSLVRRHYNRWHLTHATQGKLKPY